MLENFMYEPSKETEISTAITVPWSQQISFSKSKNKGKTQYTFVYAIRLYHLSFHLYF